MENSRPDQGDAGNGEGSSTTTVRKTEAFGRVSSPDDSIDQGKRPFYKRPKVMIVLISVVVVAAVSTLIWWLNARNFESTDDAFVDGHIVHVAPRVAGRVVSLNVKDNQLVDANTVLLEIDPADYQARLAQAIAAVRQAEGALAQAKANLAVQQAMAEQARADVQVAEANASNAASDLQRFQELPPQARSRQQLDNATAGQKTTAANLIASQKKAAAADAQVMAASTMIQAAEAQVAQARAQQELAQLNLNYTKVTADQAGYVTQRNVEKGNYVQVGQELMAVVPADMWVRANFKETQLTLMKPGQPVTIKIDAYPGRSYRGHVDSIQAGTGAVFSLLPPENATGNYVKVVQRVPVKIDFDEVPEGKIAPGMSVIPKVRVRE